MPILCKEWEWVDFNANIDYLIVFFLAGKKRGRVKREGEGRNVMICKLGKRLRIIRTFFALFYFIRRWVLYLLLTAYKNEIKKDQINWNFVVVQFFSGHKPNFLDFVCRINFR